MTAEPGVDAGAADNESTGLIKRIDAPLPPYAQPAPAGYAPPPPGNGAPLPPPKTMADAMVEVSTPPLAVDGPLLVKQPSPAPTAAVTPATRRGACAARFDAEEDSRARADRSRADRSRADGGRACRGGCARSGTRAGTC